MKAERPRSTWQILQSVLGALFGVQSDHTRQADFEQKSPLPYLLIGIALIAFFVLGLVLVARQVVGG